MIPFDAIRGRVVGVQLPDGLKRMANEIAKELERRGYEVIVSGDSCFGACDIDERLLEIADTLLHFAHTPIIEDERIVYVPYQIDYDPRINIDIAAKRLALIATAQYCHRLAEVKEHLEVMGYEVELRTGSGRVRLPGQVLGCNYSVLRGSGADAVLFIGDGLFHALGAAMYTGKKVYAYDPRSGQLTEVDAEEFERRRYSILSACIGKRLVGIIVSKKPGQRRLQLAMKLKRLAADLGITADIVYIDDVTDEKLVNLPYEFYVNTACPRLTYDDFERFTRPIISPAEFEVLLGIRDEITIDEID